MKELICICCPKGCHLEIDEKTLEVKGNTCPRGAKYGVEELTHPTRVLTSTVKLVGGMYPRLPVKSNKPLPKESLFEVMKLLDDVVIKSPIHIGDVVIKNVLGLDVDIVATKNL